MTDHYTCDECGGYLRTCGHRGTAAVTNALPTPKLGPEHIEALVEAIGGAEDEVAEMRKTAGWNSSAAWTAEYTRYAEAAEQRAARLAEIRAYLESL